MSTVRKLVVDAIKIKTRFQQLEKTRKKGLLTKMLKSNSNRSSALMNILTESDRSKTRSTAESDHKVSDDEFLKKYNQMPKGGPNHSIAQNRAHHLTKFLKQYLLNAFQTGHFQAPEMPEKFKKETIDSNGFVKNEYLFELTDVELLTDLTKLRIFWSISGIEELDLEIENSLEKRLKNQIRSHLTNQRVMNYVPTVEFVRDNSKVLADKLDEYLMKIKIEKEASKEESTTNSCDNNDITRKSESKNKSLKIDNLYGIDVTRLMDTIKKNNDNIPWSPETSPISTKDTDKSIKLLDDKNKLEKPGMSSKFQLDLRTYQIHQRMKHEKMSRRALNILEMQKFQQTL